ALSRDGTLLVIVCEDKVIRLFDTATGRISREFNVELGDKAARVTLRPDGKAFAVTAARDRGIHIYDTSNGKLLTQLVAPVAPFSLIRYSPDGSSLVMNSDERKDALRIWDTATGKEHLRLKESLSNHQVVSFSPDGKLLAARQFQSPNLGVWDVTTGKQV